MASEHVERKLTTILASDVVGYSRLTGADEELTLARLRALRSDLIDPIIAVHRGRVVKRTGDGSILEFHSVVDAVRCAIEVQDGMVERNAGLPPERKIEFRIGIHLGDVMVETDGDLMGDGVNIAARLESICEPGAICLSEQAYWQVKARLDLAVSDLGDKDLKNIAEPVHVFSLEVGKPATAKPAKPVRSRTFIPFVVSLIIALIVIVVGAWYFVSSLESAPRVASNAQAPTQTARLSIVIMPFANLSGDPGQDYFAEGITEDLTTALSRIRGAFVIARSTAMTFKGKNVDAKEIGKELGVRYVLEGSVQRDGNRVRVNTQLISADKGAQLWANAFNENIADLFKLQDEIVSRLARAMQIELVNAESRRSIREGSQNPDAIDLAMRGWSFMYRTPAKQNDVAARALFQHVLKIDSNNADAMVGLANVDLRDHVNGWTDPGIDGWKLAMTEAEQAIALDPNYAYAYYIKADLLAYSMKPGDEQVGNEGLASAETALRISPSLAPGYYVSAIIETMLGRYEPSISHLQQAIRLSPRDYLLGPWLQWMGRDHFGLHQYDAAIQDELKSIDSGYRTFQPYLTLAGAYAANGNDDKARQAISEMLHANPQLSIAWFHAHLPALIDWPPGLLPALRKAGLPEG